MNIINLGNRITNSYLLKLSKGYLLIDTGYFEHFYGFLKRLEKHGIGIKEIQYILLTHAHDDHAGFLDELLNRTEAKVILHKDAVYRLSRGVNSFYGGSSGKLSLVACKFMEVMGKGKHEFPPVDCKERYILADEESLDLEGILGGKIIFLPGHTSDSIGLMLENGTLFCGDAAMNGIPSVSRITIWIESVEEYIKSWGKMIALKPITIYPGHGKPFPVVDLKKNLNNVSKVRIRWHK
ncbi:MAG TPA: MBL fold metallo-hydrolase [Anaerovoracaceae bacterium]|nr:MBL fold metallo-hydrolase [Anaerovoracaceae bacterium]